MTGPITPQSPRGPIFPDYAVKDWIKMQHYDAIASKELNEDLQRVTDEQVAKSERSAALESALQAWRMEE